MDPSLREGRWSDFELKTGCFAASVFALVNAFGCLLITFTQLARQFVHRNCLGTFEHHKRNEFVVLSTESNARRDATAHIHGCGRVGGEMLIEITVEKDVAILRMTGRFTTGSDSEYLYTKDELSRTDLRKVLMDCRLLPYLDSTGLSFMVGLYNHLKDFGGLFGLVNVGPRVHEVLRITRLNGVIPTFDDEQSGLAACKDPDSWSAYGINAGMLCSSEPAKAC